MRLKLPLALLTALLISLTAAHADGTSTTLLNPEDGGVTSSGNYYFLSQNVTWQQDYSYVAPSPTNTVLSVGTMYGEGSLSVENNAAVDVAGSLHVGGWGWGSGYDSAVDPVNNGHVYVGAGSTLAVGTASGQDGTNSQLNLGAGVGATGTMVVDGGTVTSHYALNVGTAANSVGELTIRNGGQVIVQNGDNIAGDGTSFFVVGYYAGSEGKVTIEGEDSSLVVLPKGDGSAATYMGMADSDGVLEVKDGASVDTALTILGYSAEGSGVIRVEDATLTTGAAYVGYMGDGELIVSNGSEVAVEGQLVISGWNAGKSGEVTVSGADSVLTVSGTTYVGNGAATTGTLSVEEGAKLELETVSVYSSSSVSISDGSTVEVAGDMIVNQGASVTLADGESATSALTVSGTYYNAGSTSVELAQGASFAAGGVLNTGSMNVTVDSGSSFSVGTFANEGTASIVAAEGATCNLGDLQLVSGSMSLDGEGAFVMGSSSSETVFTVSGASPESVISTFIDISTLGSGNFAIDTSSVFTLNFSDDIQLALIDRLYAPVDLELTLITGFDGFTLTPDQLEEILGNTRYVFSSKEGQSAAVSSVSPLYGFTVTGASYEMRGSNLVWTGTVTAIPEPATATLSLLALAALAARRRRR